MLEVIEASKNIHAADYSKGGQRQALLAGIIAVNMLKIFRHTRRKLADQYGVKV